MELIEKAKKATLNSYSPYSNFKVGAALLTKNNEVYLGSNIENSSYTPTCCAERVAFYKAISDGIREFDSIAIVGNTNPCYPCGVCRQVMSEFCDEDFKIYLIDNEKILEYKLNEMNPYSFKLEN